MSTTRGKTSQKEEVDPAGAGIESGQAEMSLTKKTRARSLKRSITEKRNSGPTKTKRKSTKSKKNSKRRTKRRGAKLISMLRCTTKKTQLKRGKASKRKTTRTKKTERTRESKRKGRSKKCLLSKKMSYKTARPITQLLRGLPNNPNLKKAKRKKKRKKPRKKKSKSRRKTP